MKDIFKVHNIDARKISTIVDKEIVDVTITSPPYFDLKDYGSTDQIGFGQHYDEYLADLRLVFEQVYHITKETGTLWVVIDAFKKDGEVVPLPFDFSNEIKKVGWKLQEIIIWGKDRTVPWNHKGQMRNQFEYILMFSKEAKNYNFFKDSVRDYQSLKKWWVKYPERYNPRGKTPEAIWNFDIPTQGSWGNGYIRHFCPLPEDLIAQILKLTTIENDVVLDCFSGSGAVLAKASNMNRKYIGFELNKNYIEMFNKYLKETGLKKREEYEFEMVNTFKQEKFKDLILDLRALKFAKVLLQKINANHKRKPNRILVKESILEPTKKISWKVYDYILETESELSIDQLESIVSKPPLSKFGIEPNFKIVAHSNNLADNLESEYIYTYTLKNTHKYSRKVIKSELDTLNKEERIVSELKISLNEENYG